MFTPLKNWPCIISCPWQRVWVNSNIAKQNSNM